MRFKSIRAVRLLLLALIGATLLLHPATSMAADPDPLTTPPAVLAEDDQAQEDIVGGVVAVPHSWPWQARITVPAFPAVYCGGTLVAPQWVVTAAHCLFDGNARRPNTDFRVTLGDHDVAIAEAAEQVRTVAHSVMHPNYRRGISRDSDIALLRLNTPVTITPQVRVIPSLITGGADAAGAQGTTTGWGWIQSGGPTSQVLRQVQTPIITNAACATMLNSTDVTANMLCAGTATQGACSGDSGGPFAVFNNGTARWELAGIVSWGSGTCNNATVYVRVASFVGWINQYLTATAPAVGLTCTNEAGFFDCWTSVSGGIAPYSHTWSATGGSLTLSGPGYAYGRCTAGQRVTVTVTVRDDAGNATVATRAFTCRSGLPLQDKQ